MKRPEWHKVYRMHVESGLDDAEWKILREFVLERDDQICFRCDKKFRAKSKLSIHHIMPRSKGGTNDVTNLMTLCHPCHDHVEMNELTTKAAIMGSYKMAGVETIEKPEKEDLEDDKYNRPEWHRYVYGGKRH